MATCDLSTLQTDGCTNQFLQAAQDEVMFRALLLQLACNISEGGGGGGGSAGVGSPEGVVTASPGAVYIDTSTNSLWVKRTGTHTNTGWVQMIA